MDIEWINNLSPQLATFLLAMLPITELRVSIPVALETFDLPIWQAYVLSVVGDIIPGVLIIYFIGPISRFLRKWRIADKFFVWLFAHTRSRFDAKYKVWGNLALLFFVAIPLPFTGVWTGSVAAWLFGIKKKDSLIYIILGAMLAGVLVTLISLGIFGFFKSVL
ncbi:small multi-drug export protein [Candidatus Parcubacteria bacterium]|jgi:uncharacterized membrane protein|nr:small multi-drug export protein [Candidatus Parcubacteria bacterium]MBT7227897.1 small multi-drug export protein [Candidatus Parcubacteria bacterium]